MSARPSIPPAAGRQQARQLFQSGQFLQTREACENLCRQHPGDAELHYMPGSTSGQPAGYHDAVRSLQACIRLQPEAFVAYWALAAALNALQRHAKAEQSLRRMCTGTGGCHRSDLCNGPAADE